MSWQNGVTIMWTGRVGFTKILLLSTACLSIFSQNWCIRTGKFSNFQRDFKTPKSQNHWNVYPFTKVQLKLQNYLPRLMIIIVPVCEIQDQILIFQVSTVRRKESRRGKESSPQLSQIFRIYTGRGQGPLLPARITPSKHVILTRSTRWRNLTLWVIHTNFLEKN